MASYHSDSEYPFFVVYLFILIYFCLFFSFTSYGLEKGLNKCSHNLIFLVCWWQSIWHQMHLLICSFFTSFYLSCAFTLTCVSNVSLILALSAASEFWSYWRPLLLWDFFYFHRKRNNRPKESTAQNPKVVIMSWLINTLSDILISMRSERAREGDGDRPTWQHTHYQN